MISQLEAAAYLEKQSPGISGLTKDGITIYQSIRRFLAYTARSIREQNYEAAGHCFSIAGKLYDRGNAIVRDAIDQVFVGSFPTLLSQARGHQRDVAALIPASLYMRYQYQPETLRQVMYPA